jgi:Anaphase-promoting complex subunit 4 WD40 domain
LNFQEDLVAVGTDLGTVEIHRISKKSCVCKFDAKNSRVRSIQAVKFASGEMWIVVAASNGDISVWSYKV